MSWSGLRTAALVAFAVFAAHRGDAQTCDEILAALRPPPGRPDALARVLARRPNLNCLGGDDTSPLSRALSDRNLAAVDLLLRSGANPDFADDGESPLLAFLIDRAFAGRPSADAGPLRESDETLVRMLVNAGANLGVRDAGHATPLCHAARWGSEATVRLLLARGADPAVRDKQGYTALIYAAAGRSPAIVTLLLQRGLPVNAAAADGQTAVLVAARSGGAAVLDVLIAAGGDLGVRTPEGATPLILAAEANDTKSAALLLARGADPNAQTGPRNNVFVPGLTKVRTPLMHAAERGNDALVRLLLAAGARALTRSEQGLTASEFAFHAGHQGTRAVLRLAERGEFAPVARHLMAEEVALRTIEHLAIDAPPAVATAFTPTLLAQVQEDVAAMAGDWRAPSAAREDELAWSLTRAAKAFEWAVHTADAHLARRVAEDLAAKRKDCDARPERRFGAVRVSVRTLANNVERTGVQVRYLEGFYFDLLPRRPDLASLWREFARVSAIVDEPLPAGDYVMVAWADGRPISEPKPVSVGRNRSTRFDLVLR